MPTATTRGDRRGWGRLAGAAALLAAAPTRAAAQCAMCSTAIGSNGSVARGFAISILFLLTTLLVLVLAFVALVVRRVRAGDGGLRPARAGHRLMELRWRLSPRRSASSSFSS